MADRRGRGRLRGRAGGQARQLPRSDRCQQRHGQPAHGLADAFLNRERHVLSQQSPTLQRVPRGLHCRPPAWLDADLLGTSLRGLDCFPGTARLRREPDRQPAPGTDHICARPAGPVGPSLHGERHLGAVPDHPHHGPLRGLADLDSAAPIRPRAAAAVPGNGGGAPGDRGRDGHRLGPAAGSGGAPVPRRHGHLPVGDMARLAHPVLLHLGRRPCFRAQLRGDEPTGSGTHPALRAADLDRGQPGNRHSRCHHLRG